MPSSTRRSLVIAAIFAAVLLALFVFGTARGLGDRRGGCSKEDREAWRERLLRPEPVAAGQLAGCTSSPGPFVVPGECTLTVAAADVRSRRLVIGAIDPVGITVFTDADGRRIRMRPEIAPGDRTELSIGKDGGTVSFRCLTGTTCRARVE